MTTQAEYNELLAEYNELITKAERYKAVSASQGALVDIPNAKDRDQWLAGGTLKNETYPGGGLYSIDSVPAIGTTQKVGDTSALLNGEILTYLQAPLLTIEYLLKGGNALDLMFIGDVGMSAGIVLEVTAYNSEGDGVYSSVTSIMADGEGNAYKSDSFGATSRTLADTSMQELSDAWSNRTDLTSMLNAHPITLAIAAFNMATGESATIQTKLTGAVLGTIQATFNGLATKALTGALGLTGISGTVFGAIFGGVLNELTEMAMGLDASFGFGGEYDKEVSKKLGTDAYEKQEGLLGLTGRMLDLGYATHMLDSRYKEYTDLSTNVTVGYGYEFRNEFGKEVEIATRTQQEMFEAVTSYDVTETELGVLDMAQMTEEELAAYEEEISLSASKEKAVGIFDSYSYEKSVLDAYNRYTAEVQSMFDLSNKDMARMGYEGYYSYGEGNLSAVSDPSDLSTGDFRSIERSLQKTIGEVSDSISSASRSIGVSYSGGSGNDDGNDYGSSNNPSGGYGASGYGSSVGGFGGGM